MKKIKVVQIGLGHDHATAIFDSVLYQNGIFDVVGFAVPESEETEFADRVASYKNNRHIPQYSVDEALSLPGLDGAIIETEEVNLTKYAIMAAERGLHIHMDKPGGLDLSEFEKLIEILKAKKLAFSIGYMYRFNPVIIETLEKVKRGDIGEVYAVEAHMDCEHPANKRQWLDRFPGGMMFYLGCHLIDLIYQIQGEPEEIIPMNIGTKLDGVTADDYGMALFKYPRGISFAKACANEMGGFLRRQLVICGSRGTIEIRPLERYIADEKEEVGRCNQNTDIREVYTGGGWNDNGIIKTSKAYNRYDAMMCSFVQFVCGEKENPYTYDYELNLYKLILRACGGDKR